MIPLEFDQARVPVDGKLRVFRARDAGSSWQPLASGLPQERVLQSVYRQAFCHDGTPDSAALGLYFGTSGGHVYVSDDGGNHWRELLAHAAAVTAVRCA